MADSVLFVAFPYLAVVVAVIGSILRYRRDQFSYSSQSSELLGKRALFWGIVPWHYAIILILTAHLLAFLFPGTWALLIASPPRLYVLEVIGLSLAVTSLFGLALLILRRLFDWRAMAVTTILDWVVLFALLAQVALGFWVALFYRWGSDWYLHTAVPWLRSLVVLDPQTQYVSVLPWTVKLHMLGGFVLLFLFPFTRLVHIVTFPITYLWRPYQVVIFNRRPRRAIQPKS
ncbi:MAG: respiratory nitrate reductase subunit gamma [Thermomicrobiales bacterium]|nr:respiratory nitrate reductase subunit gamma [Thermomicrobiales bacterium]